MPALTDQAHKRKLLNVSLRAVTLGSRFLLLFFLARYLEPGQVGLYGLLAATITYSLYLLGFDFYNYSAREISACDSSEWGRLLKAQAGFQGVLYVLVMPALALLFLFEILPTSLAAWFYALLVLEHINQELFRLLVAMFRPLTASLVLFLRSGCWALLVVALMLVNPALQSLEAVLAAWTLGALAATLLGAGTLYRMHLGGWREKIDWRWVRRGVAISLPLLAATLALRGIYTVDRYWFAHLEGLDVLAAYVLFLGIAGALVSFLESGVFAFSYPAMVKSWAGQCDSQFKRETKELLGYTMGLTIAFIALAQLVMPFLLNWIGNPIYINHAGLFGLIMAGTAAFSVSMVPHYALYAQGKDEHILYSHFLGLGMFVLTTWVVSAYDTTTAIPWGLCMGFLSVLTWKTCAYILLTPENFSLLRATHSEQG